MSHQGKWAILDRCILSLSPTAGSLPLCLSPSYASWMERRRQRQGQSPLGSWALHSQVTFKARNVNRSHSPSACKAAYQQGDQCTNKDGRLPSNPTSGHRYCEARLSRPSITGNLREASPWRAVSTRYWGGAGKTNPVKESVFYQELYRARGTVPFLPVAGLREQQPVNGGQQGALSPTSRRTPRLRPSAQPQAPSRV